MNPLVITRDNLGQRQGRVPLFGAWDDLSEHLLRLPLSGNPGDAATPTPGLVHWSATTGHAVIDRREWQQPLTQAQPMAMDDLFEALHA